MATLLRSLWLVEYEINRGAGLDDLEARAAAAAYVTGLFTRLSEEGAGG